MNKTYNESTNEIVHRHRIRQQEINKETRLDLQRVLIYAEYFCDPNRKELKKLITKFVVMSLEMEKHSRALDYDSSIKNQKKKYYELKQNRLDI